MEAHVTEDITVIQLAYHGAFYFGLAAMLYLAVGLLVL